MRWTSAHGIVVLAGVTLWDRALGVPILVGPPAAAVVGGALLAVTVLVFAVARHGVRKATRETALERDGYREGRP